MKNTLIILSIFVIFFTSCVKEIESVGLVKAKVMLYDSLSKPVFDYSDVSVSFIGKTNVDGEIVSREIKITCDSKGEFEIGSLVNEVDYEITVSKKGYVSVKKTMKAKSDFQYPLDSVVLRQLSFRDVRFLKVRLFDSSGNSISKGKLYVFDTKSLCNMDNIDKANYSCTIQQVQNTLALSFKTYYWVLASYVDQYNNTYYSAPIEVKMGEERFYTLDIAINVLDDAIQKFNVQCQLNSGILKNSLVYLINANKPFNLKDTSNALQKGYVNSQGKVSFSGLNKGQLLYVVAFNRYNNTLFSDSTVIQIGKNSVYNINKLHRVLNLENKIFPNYGYRFFVSIDPNTTEGIYNAKVNLYKSSIVMNADSNFTKSVDGKETDKDGNVVYEDLDAGESYFIKAYYKLNETEYVNVPIQQTVKILDATEIKLILIKQ
jgi:hypothetical protein